MKAKKYRFNGKKICHLRELPTNASQDDVNEQDIIARTARNIKKMSKLQEKLYADGREGLIIVFQAIDAAGKDSTIEHVCKGLNPQGVIVHSFKAPTSEDLAHDYLWRVNKCLPRRGEIAILNRSHYEDVITVKIHEMQKNYKMAERTIGKDTQVFFEERYKQICHYESYLYQNSYRIVKIFLNISKDEQKKRFLNRIDRQDKNWKFSSSDLKERALFDTYVDQFEEVINATAKRHALWYALPADDKWYTRYLVTEIILDELNKCHPDYPDLPDEEKARLEEARLKLMNE
ncbi:MAG: hypothetical protein J6P61_09205 [Erysipelotrichaceae bacterium]|nr:hypothetical protein [Erysipelotrichaceae bacterium]